jgi:hypothetical protein
MEILLSIIIPVRLISLYTVTIMELINVIKFKKTLLFDLFDF